MRCPQSGHSYAISPGSPASGAMVTTSFIAVPHLEHERGLAINARTVCFSIFQVAKSIPPVRSATYSVPPAQRSAAKLVPGIGAQRRQFIGARINCGPQSLSVTTPATYAETRAPTRASPTTDSNSNWIRKGGSVTTEALHFRFTVAQPCILLTCNLRNLQKLLLFV